MGMFGGAKLIGCILLLGISILPQCPEGILPAPSEQSDSPPSHPELEISLKPQKTLPLVTTRKETLKIGDSGEKVKKLQQFLADVQLYHSKITGIYDDATAKAVKEFQKIFGIKPTGQVDPVTAKQIARVQNLEVK